MSSGRLCWRLGKAQRKVRSVLWLLELSELWVHTFNIEMFCPPKALPSGGGSPAGRWTGRVPSLYILATPKYFCFKNPGAWPAPGAVQGDLGCVLRKSRLVTANVRFAPLCGLKSDISRGQRSATCCREQMQQHACRILDATPRAARSYTRI